MSSRSPWLRHLPAPGRDRVALRAADAPRSPDGTGHGGRIVRVWGVDAAMAGTSPERATPSALWATQMVAMVVTAGVGLLG